MESHVRSIGGNLFGSLYRERSGRWPERRVQVSECACPNSPSFCGLSLARTLLWDLRDLCSPPRVLCALHPFLGSDLTCWVDSCILKQVKIRPYNQRDSV